MCYGDRRIRYKSAGGKARARFLTVCPWYHHIGVFGYFAIALQKNRRETRTVLEAVVFFALVKENAG